MVNDAQKSRRFSWGIAVCMTAALFVFIAFKMDVRYAIDDDAAIMRSLMGSGTGVPSSFQLYMHGLLVWPIVFLHSLISHIPWFSWVQLALLFLALTVICKNLMLCFIAHRKPIWAGAVLAASFLIAFGLEYTTQFTYTCTAAMLGASAVSQILSIDFMQGTAKQILRSTLAAALLLSLCYALRLKALLPAAAFCALAYVFRIFDVCSSAKGEKRNLRPILISLLIIIGVLGSLLGIRQIEVSIFPSQEYLEWDKERIEALDYRGLSNVPQDALAEAGWDETTLHLAQNWCFLDADINTEALQTINDALEEQDNRTFTDRLRDVKRIIRGRVNKSAYAFRLMSMALIAGITAAMGTLFMPGCRIRLLMALAGTACGLVLMIVYLALQGRLPLRAVSAVAMPAIVMTLCLLPACLPRTRLSRLLICAITAAVLIHTLISVAPLYRLLQRYPWTEQPGKAYGELESYAVKHPDSLFIVDTELATTDVNPFPSYPDGLPMNISYWGGWDMRSPSSEQLFARFGLDVWNIGAEAFLREDVFFASAQETPPQILLDWLGAETGFGVGWDVVARQGGVYILHFHEIEALP